MKTCISAFTLISIFSFLFIGVRYLMRWCFRSYWYQRRGLVSNTVLFTYVFTLLMLRRWCWRWVQRNLSQSQPEFLWCQATRNHHFPLGRCFWNQVFWMCHRFKTLAILIKIIITIAIGFFFFRLGVVWLNKNLNDCFNAILHSVYPMAHSASIPLVVGELEKLGYTGERHIDPLSMVRVSVEAKGRYRHPARVPSRHCHHHHCNQHRIVDRHDDIWGQWNLTCEKKIIDRTSMTRDPWATTLTSLTFDLLFLRRF